MSKLPPLRESSKQPDMRPPKLDTGQGLRKAPPLCEKAGPIVVRRARTIQNYDFKGQKRK
jgi:hypothetical protein